MKKHLIIFNFIIILSLFLAGCFPVTTTNQVKKQNVGTTYNPFIYKLHPEYFIYRLKDSHSRLYTKLNLVELMFAPIGQNRTYQGKIKVEYFIYKPEELSNVVDSASIIYDIKKRKGQNNAITYINVKDNDINEYYLKVKTTDMLRRSSVEDFLYINVTEESSGQNFIINQKKTNAPYFRNYFRNDQVFSIQHNDEKDSVFIRYYKEEVPLPPPPFSSMLRSAFYPQPDSIWSVVGKGPFQFSERKEGFYYLQTDTTAKTGLFLLNSGSDFPYVKNSKNMAYPLQYLMSTAEFNKLLESSNKKLAVDRFWLSCGGNLNRARELIRIYYNRTLYANIYFTSFTDGWRTDRGMIYLMFGPPKSVKKSPEKETLIYSDRLNYKMLQFVFNRVTNPYTNNDFILERNLDFKSFWFKSIESWRKGKVYTVFR